MPHQFLLVNQSDYLTQTVDIKSHAEWQTVQIQISWHLRSQLIWIYTISKTGYIQDQQDKGKGNFDVCILWLDCKQLKQKCSFWFVHPTKNWNQSVHLGSLIRVFVLCMKNFASLVSKMRPMKMLIRLCNCSGWIESLLGAPMQKFVFWPCRSVYIFWSFWVTELFGFMWNLGITQSWARRHELWYSFSRVHTCQGNVREIYFFSRAGICQGILWCVSEKYNYAKMSGNFAFQPDEARMFGPDVFFLLNS